jgi:hypothetical protein
MKARNIVYKDERYINKKEYNILDSPERGNITATKPLNNHLPRKKRTPTTKQ